MNAIDWATIDTQSLICGFGFALWLMFFTVLATNIIPKLFDRLFERLDRRKKDKEDK